MEVKEAVKFAKEYIADLYDGEGISNIGLEEVDFDDKEKEWAVTIGFFRPWEQPNNNTFTTNAVRRNSRTYKVVHINDFYSKVTSVKNLDVAS